ncbi:MAG: hypothetical protein BMS9Abin20_0048 [Acidimicrobiia bacterium]|nr:MAG: hypothetical protein BMS9Abin20_0048 [Acidimicrobiia bacterium]
MARRKRRTISDVDRYTGSASRPPSFRDEPVDNDIASGTSFILISLTVFIAISFAAVYFGTQNIEENLEVRSLETLEDAEFYDVEVEATGATVRLTGSITTEQSEDDAFSAVAALAGVRSVEGRLWPVFSGDLDEIVVTGDAIEINWDRDSATIEGSVASEERKTFVSEALIGVFPAIDVDDLVVLEGLEEEPGWLGKSLGLLISIQPSMPAGRMIIDPNGKLLVVGGEVEGKDLRNELNAKVIAVGEELGFSVNPAIRVLETGPTEAQIEELQVNLDDLIEGKTVEFETKSFELTEKGIALLEDVIDALRQAPEIRVQIAGHTDSKGSSDANLQLSMDRANAVLGYLVAAGESRERFDVIGYGESQPTASNDTKDGRARNRRIEFTALEGSS